MRLGFCKEGDTPTLAWCGLHKGEEYPISGENGSLMFFFKGCTLGCATCQNNQISIDSKEFKNYKTVSSKDIAMLMMRAEDVKATSVSFVTAEHFVPHIIKAVSIAREMGFKKTTVFNTSGFMKKETIDLLLPYIDIWLWDTKTLSQTLAEKYFGSAMYPKFEEEALEDLLSKIEKSEMETPYPHGVIVRHLVLPSHIKESEDVINNFAKKCKDKCYFSLMYQFIPPKNSSDELKTRLSKEDTERLENIVFESGIENGFIQELSENEEVWRPDFNRKNPFPEGFATPL